MKNGQGWVIVAGQIDWARFDVAFAWHYCPDTGAPAKAIRLLVGLHYLKHALSLSDEALVDRWVESPYWQYFCGHGVSPCEEHATRCSTKYRRIHVADEVASAGR